MTLFIIKIVEGTLLAILIAYNLFKHLLSWPARTRDTAQ